MIDLSFFSTIKKIFASFFPRQSLSVLLPCLLIILGLLHTLYINWHANVICHLLCFRNSVVYRNIYSTSVNGILLQKRLNKHRLVAPKSKIFLSTAFALFVTPRPRDSTVQWRLTSLLFYRVQMMRCPDSRG